jgi:hypothetical protein
MDATTWAVWRRLTRRFSIVRMPLECLVSPGAWGFFSADVVSGLRQPLDGGGARDAGALEPARLREVALLAEVNQRRQDAAFSGDGPDVRDRARCSADRAGSVRSVDHGMVRRSDSWTLPALAVFAALVLLRWRSSGAHVSCGR